MRQCNALSWGDTFTQKIVHTLGRTHVLEFLISRCAWCWWVQRWQWWALCKRGSRGATQAFGLQPLVAARTSGERSKRFCPDLVTFSHLFQWFFLPFCTFLNGISWWDLGAWFQAAAWGRQQLPSSFHHLKEALFTLVFFSPQKMEWLW